MAEVAYGICHAWLTEEFEQSTQRGQRGARACCHEHQSCDARVFFVATERLFITASAIRAQDAEEEIGGVAHIGRRPGRDLRATAFQYVGGFEDGAARGGSRRERAIFSVIGDAETRH